VAEALFDRSAEYDEMLNRGLRLSGEDKTYFLAGRVADLLKQLPRTERIARILDFGCGIGDSSAYLAEVFPDSEVVGTDTAEGALEHARRANTSPRLRFVGMSELAGEARFDLCYVNGVFHHIEPSQRRGAVDLIRAALRPGGLLALFENNPWNPGTRMVMRRIPFDRDAKPLSAIEARSLLGHFDILATRFLFYFPRPLGFLRFTEPWFARVPMGAQYYVLARS
jgi:SAM-dependent methyltransferase